MNLIVSKLCLSTGCPGIFFKLFVLYVAITIYRKCVSLQIKSLYCHCQSICQSLSLSISMGAKKMSHCGPGDYSTQNTY